MYGTISHGTLRYVDLIPTFVDELIVRGSNAKFDLNDHDLIAKLRESDSDFDLSDSELDHAAYLMVALIEALNEVAPNGYHFSTHPGDGSDYGYWPNEED